MTRLLATLCLSLLLLPVASGDEAEPSVKKLPVGKPAPDFTVTVREGKELKLSDFRGKSHLVIVFGRAHW